MGLFKPSIKKLLRNKDIDGIIAASKDDNINRRENAVEALEKIATPKAIDSILKVMNTDNSIQLRMKCFTILDKQENRFNYSRDDRKRLIEEIAAIIQKYYSRTRKSGYHEYDYPSDPLKGDWIETTVSDPDIDSIRNLTKIIPSNLYNEVRELSGNAKYLFDDTK